MRRNPPLGPARGLFLQAHWLGLLAPAYTACLTQLGRAVATGKWWIGVACVAAVGAYVVWQAQDRHGAWTPAKRAASAQVAQPGTTAPGLPRTQAALSPQPPALPAATPSSSVQPGPSAQRAHLPANTPVFVLNSLSGNVSVIDPTTWTEVRRIPTGKEPHHLYLTPDEKSVIVANAGADSLTFIDPRTGELQRTLRGILDPYHLRFSPNMKWFVTAANRLNHIDLYRWDGNEPTLVKRIPTGKTPSHLWIDSQSRWIWSSMQDSDELVVIDLATQTLTHRVPTGSLPADVYVTPDDKTLFLGLTGGTGVEVYDVAGGKAPQLIGKIATGRTPSHLWIDANSTTVWSSMQDSDELVTIDLASQTLTYRTPTGKLPADIFGTPDGRHLLLGLTGGTGVEVYDVAGGKAPELVGKIATGKGAHAFRAAGDQRHVYVSNRVANTISSIDYHEMKAVETLPGPSGPDCMDVSADGTLIMVGSRWAGKLSLIDVRQRKVVHQVKVGKSPHGVWTLDHASRV